MDNLISQLPAGILDAEAHQLHRYVTDLTLVHIPGKIVRPLFISILQHGNEITGWQALRQYLKQNLSNLPRSIYLLFGNISAARLNVRQLESGIDFNRCWPGLRTNRHPIALKIAEITAFIKSKKPFASVDIHNNTGRNPHYSGISAINKEHINLASLFSETIIHFTSPDGIQSGAFAQFCPAITIECGMSGTADGIHQTITFLQNLTRLSNLKQLPGIAERQQVMNIFAVVKAHKDISLGVEGDISEPVDFEIPADLDYHNFHLLEAGTVFGTLANDQVPMPLQVTDQAGHDITEKYFRIESQQVILQTPVMPAMITLSIAAIRLDCLCYLIRPLTFNS